LFFTLFSPQNLTTWYLLLKGADEEYLRIKNLDTCYLILDTKKQRS
jgi:hypothetical protein